MRAKRRVVPVKIVRPFPPLPARPGRAVTSAGIAFANVATTDAVAKGASVALCTHERFVAALGSASAIAVSAYVLHAGSDVVRALERAGDRGADVAVTLDGKPYFGKNLPGEADSTNAAVAGELRRHGVAVRLTDPDESPEHLKAAVIDGDAYLDDRNWPERGNDTIVALEDPRDVAAVAGALRGAPLSNDRLALEKSQALVLEAKVIACATGDRIDVESETFGYTPVSAALYARAKSGTHVRLAVNARALAQDAKGFEHAALTRLESAGVDVRIVRGDEKLCVAGDRAWVGSANATYSANPMLDWGLQTTDEALRRGLNASFEKNWKSGMPYAPNSASAVAPVRAITSPSGSANSPATNSAVALMNAGSLRLPRYGMGAR